MTARGHRGLGWKASVGILCLTLFTGSQAAADLVGYWTFDGGNAADSSGYGNTYPLLINGNGKVLANLDEVSVWADALTDGMAIAIYNPIPGSRLARERARSRASTTCFNWTPQETGSQRSFPAR